MRAGVEGRGGDGSGGAFRSESVEGALVPLREDSPELDPVLHVDLAAPGSRTAGPFDKVEVGLHGGEKTQELHPSTLI